jgi:hypothetical protein
LIPLAARVAAGAHLEIAVRGVGWRADGAGVDETGFDI